MKLKRIGALALSLALTLSLTVPAHAATFTDIADDYWAKDYIAKMANRGYAKGYDDGTFKPEGKMTAAETLLFCARATGIDSATQTKLAEVYAEEMEEILPEGMYSWAGKEMAVAVEAGVLSLTELEALAQTDPKTVTESNPNGRTYLEQTITRENLCMYLVRAMQLKPLAKSLSSYPLSFGDKTSISAALQPYVYVLNNFGIVQGDDLGNFNPQGAVTRAQMTTMLCRTLDFMASAGIEVELSEYTDYDWTAGTISAVTSGADGSIILTLTGDITGTRSFSLPSGAKIFEDNMLTSSSALKVGQYVRLNLNDNGSIREARLSGVLTTYSGTVSSLADGQLSLLVNGQSRNLKIDRFTSVMIGKTVGDRSIIDEEAGYSAATCYVDETGHLAGVIFTGGTQMMEGLLESVNTVNGVTTLGITAFNGVVYRYTIPTGIAITVNGVLGSLSASQVGKYVQVRISNENGLATSVAVDTITSYIQGPIKKLGTTGTARNVTIYDQITGKEYTNLISPSVVITFNGENKAVADLESGWYATALISSNLIAQLDGYPGSTTVEGAISSISYGATTVLEITLSDDSIARYELDITDLPVIYRENKVSSIDKLRTGDNVTVTIRYNKIERIDATPQTANLSGTITKVTLEAGGVTMEVKLSDGTVETYTVSEGVSVTQGSASSNVYNLKPNQNVALVTNGSEVISVSITADASSATELTGTVYTVNANSRTMSILVTSASGTASTVQVNVLKGANLIDATINGNGNSLNLNSGFSAGDTVQLIGSYEGAVFNTHTVIKK